MNVRMHVVFLVIAIAVAIGCGPSNRSNSRDKTPKRSDETAQPDAPVKLPEPGPPLSTKESVVIIIRSAGTNEVTVHRGDGKSFTQGNDEKQEQEITKYVEAGLSGVEPFKTKKSAVLLKVERGIKYREVSRIQRAIGRVEGLAGVVVETVFSEKDSTSPEDSPRERK